MNEPWEYEREAAIEDLIQTSLKQLSEDSARTYLGRYGDAVDARISRCLGQATELTAHGYHEASLVLSCTAIELMIRFMVVRPLIQGAFLSEEWADLLTRRIGTGRTDEDRKLLPEILRQWGIDIDSVKLKEQVGLWRFIRERLLTERNKVVHAGKQASPLDAEDALLAAKSFRKNVIGAIANRLGFTLDVTGQWAEIKKEQGVLGQHGYQSSGTRFLTASPFDDHDV